MDARCRQTSRATDTRANRRVVETQAMPENEINNFRNQLKTQNINDVNSHEYTYAIGTMYMDIIQECEKLGDYVVNVVEARMNTRQHYV